MKKEVKQQGNSNIIRLTKEECRLFGIGSPIEKGDILNLIIIKHEKGDTDGIPV